MSGGVSEAFNAMDNARMKGTLRSERAETTYHVTSLQRHEKKNTDILI